MLRNSETIAITALVETVKRSLPGFVERASRNELVFAVATTLGALEDNAGDKHSGIHVGVCEAPTGTGKTIALGVAGLVLAHSRRKKLITSSSSVLLREQLLYRDLPFLLEIFPQPLTLAIAKGRQRYICNARLAHVLDKASQQSLPLGELIAKQYDPSPGSPEQLDMLQELSRRLARGDWSGDRDDWHSSIDDGLWNVLTTDRHGCAGRRCSHFTGCAFFAARQKVRDADVVVCNHDVLLGSLDMARGSVLPPPADSFYLIDEGHRLPDKATELFGARYQLVSSQTWLTDFATTARHCVLGISGVRTDSETIEAAVTGLGEAAEALRTMFKANDGSFNEPGYWRFAKGHVPGELSNLAWLMFTKSAKLRACSERLREQVAEFGDSDPCLSESLLRELGYYLRKIENLAQVWQLMMLNPGDKQSPIAKWIERSASGEYLVCAIPTDASAALTRQLFRPAAGVVIASATLRACGSFKAFPRQTGLGEFKQVTSIALPSPFDYASRARLVVPVMKTDPANAAAHTQEVLRLLPTLLTELGVLLLCTSHAQLTAIVAGLPEVIRPRLLVQGAMPKAAMRRLHRERVDAGIASTLVGLHPFGEELDLAGHYCGHVIVTQLFFPVPTDPIELAKSEWIESKGRSAFVELVLPQASVRLRQAVGRLLRTESDHGRVTILDVRLGTKRYRKELLAGLPPFKMEILGNELFSEMRRELP